MAENGKSARKKPGRQRQSKPHDDYLGDSARRDLVDGSEAKEEPDFYSSFKDSYGWFKCKPYELISMRVLQGHEFPPDPFYRKVPAIARAKRSKVVRYSYTGREDEIVLRLANDFKITEEDKKLLEQLEREADTDGFLFEDFLTEKFLEAAITFANDFGLLGIKLREIGAFKRNSGTRDISAYGHDGCRIASPHKHFGWHLSEEVFSQPYDTVGDFLKDFILSYRESVYDFVLEGHNLWQWAKQMNGHKKDSTSLSQSLSNLLSRSKPACLWGAGESRPTIIYQPCCLLDLAYLRILDRLAQGKPFRVCRNDYCRRLFVPIREHQFHCSPKCAHYHSVVSSRDGSSKPGKQRS